MTVSEREILQVAEAVWQSMLGLETQPLDSGTALRPGPLITACVLITGAFEGGVTLKLPSSSGSVLAALMFGIDADAVSRQDTADAVGELANMIGGNLQALVAQPARLSLPSVAEGDSYTVTFPGSHVTRQVAIGFDEHVVHIALHSRSDAQTMSNTGTRRSVA